MADQLAQNPRPGKHVLGPAETQIGEVFVRDALQELARARDLSAAQRQGQFGGSVEQERKRFDCGQDRIHVEVNPPRHAANAQAAAQVRSDQTEDRA